MRKIIFFLFLSLQMAAQEQTLKKGVVIDALKVSDSLDETFSVYLPVAFEGAKPWPVLFLFDKNGRGKATAQLFKSAAETQGYILASSNNIDPTKDLVQNVESAARLIAAVSRMLPIDYDQISTAGSGEGAKVATSIPVLIENIHGVIAVGDHWLNNKMLEKRKKFSFVGVVGDEQFRAAEMEDLVYQLSKLDFPSAIYMYEGGEDWPKAQIINSAVGSLTLNAMKQGLRPVDTSLIEKLYMQDLADVNKMKSDQNLISAYRFLEVIKEKYEDLRPVSEIKAMQEQLQSSDGFVQQQVANVKVQEKENRLMEDFAFYLNEDLRTANFENLGWWNYQKKQLEELSGNTEYELKLGRRLIDFIDQLATEKEQQLDEAHAPLEAMLLVNMIQTIFDPTDFDSYKEIISLSAMDNDFGTSLFYLEEMLKHGFQQENELYEIPGTLGLKLTPDFNWLVKKYLGSARFHH